MSDLPPFITLAIGLTAGGLVVWLLLRAKAGAALSRIKADFQTQIATLNERVSSKDQLLATLQSALEAEEDQKTQLAMQLQQESNSKVAAEQKSSHFEEQFKERSEQAKESQSNLAAEKQKNAELTEKTKYLEEKLATQKQEIETIQSRFQKDFEAVANKLLLENSSRFGQQSAESLDKLLAPLRENLREFKAKLESVQQDAATHSALLKEQIARIGTEAANLSKALKGDVKVLGNWGENMLDQILEKSGLQLGVHYRRQSPAKDESGDQRFLDVVVELPEDKHLIIDSKVSLRAYEDYVNCPDDLARRRHLEAHLDCIRSHVRGLGAKRYQDIHGITAPDFVLMYVPIEAAFFVAVGQDPKLFSDALEKSVVLITNSTLLATLRTVAHVWRLADQQNHALEIADRGGKLFDKFVGFIEDLQDIGNALENARSAWTEANKKLHQGAGNLVSQAEKLRALGVKASKKLPAALTAGAELESASLLDDGSGRGSPESALFNGKQDGGAPQPP